MSDGSGPTRRTGALFPSPPGRKVLTVLVEQLDEVEERLGQVDAEILAWHRASAVSKRLASIPGIGPIIASAIAATVPDASVFRSGREFAAWLGLVPRQRSTGGKQRLGRISRQGDQYLRRLLIVGAQSALLRSKVVRDSALGAGVARPVRPAQGRGGAREQDRPHRLGGDGEGGGLPPAGRCVS
jgi:transposase